MLPCTVWSRMPLAHCDVVLPLMLTCETSSPSASGSAAHDTLLLFTSITYSKHAVRIVPSGYFVVTPSHVQIQSPSWNTA